MKYITLIIVLLVVGCGTPVKELTLEEKVVGEYEIKLGEDTIKLVLLENGSGEEYKNGKKNEGKGKWKIVNGEIHADGGAENISVCRINKDGSITFIASIVEGKRTDFPKEDQPTLINIK